MEADVTVNAVTSWGRVFDFSNGRDQDNVLLGLNQGKWDSHVYHGTTMQAGITDPVASPLGVEMSMVLVYTRTGPTTGSAVLYIDGVERVSGVAALPLMVTRTINLVERSPWLQDAPLDGTVKNFKFYACDATNAPDTDAPPSHAPPPQPCAAPILLTSFADSSEHDSTRTLTFGGGFRMEADVTVNAATSWGRVFDFSNGAEQDNVLLGLNQGKWDAHVYHGATIQAGIADPVASPLGVEMSMVLVFTRTGPTTGSAVLYIDGVERVSGVAALPLMVTRTINLVESSPWAQDTPLDGTVKNFKFYACDATNAPDTDAPPTAPPETSPPATLPPLTTAPTPAPDTATPLTAAPLYAATYIPLATDTPMDTTAPATYTPAALPATDVPETTVPHATVAPDFVATLNDTAPPPLMSIADVKVVDLMGFEDSSATIAVASSAAGFSSGAALRLALVSKGCSRDLSTALHPTGFSLDNSKPVGAVAANIAMLATFIAACFVAVPVVRVVGTCLFPTFFKDRDVVGLLRLPSAPVLVFQYFYQGLTLAGMSLVFHPEKGWHAAVGAAILLVCAVVPVVLHLTITQGVPAYGVYARAEGRQNRALISLLGEGEWVSMQRNPMWVQRYTVIRPYKQGATWFLLIEFVSSFALSAIQSTAPETSEGCGHVKMASGLVFLVLLMLEGLFWPHARSRDAALDILLLGTQLAAMVVMAAGYYTATLDSWLFDVSSKLLTVAFMLLVVKIALDILTEVYVITSGRRGNLQEDVLNKSALLIHPQGRSLAILETTQSDTSDQQSDTRAEMPNASLLSVDIENGLELLSCTTPKEVSLYETPRQVPITPTKRPLPHSRGRGREGFLDSRDSFTPLLAVGLWDSFLADEAGGSATIYGGGSAPTTTGISGRDLEEADVGGGRGRGTLQAPRLSWHHTSRSQRRRSSSCTDRRHGSGLVLANGVPRIEWC